MSLVGRQIGSIRIDRPLGEGGMGEVYLGFDEKLERRVAVKTLRASGRLDADAKARLAREARLLSKVGHPAICQIYDLVEGEGADYLVLEYVEGRTLRQLMTERPSFDRLLAICRQIADGLAAAHREKIIHRDLKAENVMVSAGDRVRILDFGVARAAEPEIARREESDSAEVALELLSAELDATAGDRPGSATSPHPEFRTRLGTILGTPQYMSPEQALGRSLTTASDLFSFGVLMQELFTGGRAYPDLPLVELLRAVQRGRTAPMSHADPDLSHLVEAMKSLDPRARPTAEEVDRQLAELAEKPLRQARRRRFIAAAIVGVVLLLVGLVVVSYLAVEARQARRESERRQGQAEDLIGFMLEDLRPKLERVGRLDLLDAVGDRALAHFEAVPESELSPLELARRVDALRQVAEVRFAQGALEPAREIAERALALAQALAGEHPEAEHERALSLAATTVGSIWADLDEPATAYRLFEQALAAARRAVASAPQNPRFAGLLAASLRDTGVGLKALGRPDEAILRFSEAERLLRRRAAESPPDRTTTEELATTLAWLSSTLEESGRLVDATAARRENLALLERLTAESDDPVAQNDLATARDYLARMLLSQGNPEEAAEQQRLALATFVALAELDPQNSDWQRSAAVAHLNLGWILADLGALAEAGIELGRGSAGLEALRRLDTSHRTWNRMLAVNQYRLGVVALAAGDRRAARRYFADSTSGLEALAREAPDDPSIAMRLAETLTASASLAASDGRATEANDRREQAEELFRLHAGAEANPSFQAAYAQLLLSAGRIEAARPIVDRLRAIGYRPRRLEAACRQAGL